MPQARIEHRDEDPALNSVVQAVAHEVDDIQQMLDTLDGKTAGLNRDNKLIAGAQRVDRQDAEARRAIDQDIIIIRFDRRDHLGQFQFPRPISSASSCSSVPTRIFDGTMSKLFSIRLMIFSRRNLRGVNREITL